jgi:hypothetical protein
VAPHRCGARRLPSSGPAAVRRQGAHLSLRVRTMTAPATRPRGTRCQVPLSRSVQPTTASATADSLSSPQFAQFAPYCAPENRGVGGSIPP